MSSEWTVAAIVATLSLILAGLGVYAAWVIKVDRGERADSSAQKAHQRIDELSKELAIFKQEVARDYASNRMIEQMESRLVTAIERLGDRLDRAFEGRKP